MTQQEPPLIPDVPGLPLLHFRTSDLPDAEAFVQWRQLMAPLFHIEQARYTSALPRGNLSVFVVGEVLVNRCSFNAQHLSRDAALIAATPDHLVLQYYRSGGFRGMIAGRPVCIVRGQVTVADLRHQVDAYAAASDTIGLSVPRALLDGIDPAALTRQLDAAGNRLLGGWMASLPKRLALMGGADIPILAADLKYMLTRVFAAGQPDPGAGDSAADDEDLFRRALAMIEAHLDQADLTPAFVAAQLRTSRATLYRLFAPLGGIMRHVRERRLLAVRDALSDPIDTRSVAKLASAHGFKSAALLSRAFREHFDLSPRAWRRAMTRLDLKTRQASADPVHGLWRELGLPR